MDGTVTLLDENDTIISVIDKADYNWEKLKDYYKTVNIYKFSSAFSNQYYIPFLEAYLKSFGDNDYYEQVLKVLAFLEDTNLKGYKVSGRRWYEIDDPHDLAVAETLSAMTAAGWKRFRLGMAATGGFRGFLISAIL